ncbi:MAG: ATP-binding protein [Clostridia bacterium]|nr:ATP-binding protein [Deltaproteobacteria bacterium]
MAGASFRERALHESLRYGDDPFVFLRELVQNARDAGAKHIGVAVSVIKGTSCLVFNDDGRGMSFADAREFLFKLYASSKEGDRDNVGHFGVGFWSVLRYAPDKLRVESRTKNGEAWGVELDADLTHVSDMNCALTEPGTRITLTRASLESDLMELAQTVRERLSHYCRYVRVRRGKEPLQLVCNGERVDRELTVESAMKDNVGVVPSLALHFTCANAEGIVALGPKPKVQLYARGLLVSECTVLDELDGSATTRQAVAPANGLAPVVVLNSDRLDVVLSRRKPRAGRELRRLMRLTRSRLDRLVSHAVDGVVKRSLTQRLADATGACVRALGGGFAVAVLVVWIMVIGVAALSAMIISRGPQTSAGERTVVTVLSGDVAHGEESARMVTTARVAVSSANELSSFPTVRPIGNIVGYGGAIVDVPETFGPAWSFSYHGPRRIFFKALTLDKYDPARGFIRRDAIADRIYPLVRCGNGNKLCVSVATQVIASDAPFVLPLPTGYGVIEDTATFEGAAVAVIGNTLGEAMVQLEAGSHGVLRYQAAPISSPVGQIELPVRFDALPGAWAAMMEKARRLPAAKRVDFVADFVRANVRYDVTATTAKAFAESKGAWYQRVMDVGAGDCDVKNGLVVLLLRTLGIDARLAIGIAGQDGVARPSLHAWTEYYAAGRWHIVDATGQPARFDSEAMRAHEQVARRNVVIPTVATLPTIYDAANKEGYVEITVPSKVGAQVLVAPIATTALELEPVLDKAPVVAALPNPVGTPKAASAANGATLPMLTGWDFTRLFILVAAGGTVLAAIALRRRIRERVVTDGSEQVRREALAMMVRDMLTQPHAWRGIGRAWHQRLLPVLSGRPMSLEEALRRARDNILFVSRTGSSLAALAAQSGTPVLDASDQTFGKVVVPLLRTIDLDSIEPLLEAVRGGSSGDTQPAAFTSSTFERANAVLENANADARFVIASGLHDSPMRDVDLTRLRLPKRLGLLRRFIAVSPTHRDVRARLEKMQRDPDRGVFLWLDWSVERSG